MRPDQIYAIVDIEATGGSIGADERIIQIACILLQNNEVIHAFETLVNPGRNIPRTIKQLTGISDQDVKRAPYFEEVAPVILRLLEDTIFVAHNVGFDFRFLNEQLSLHDFAPLDIPAIDTVELTQIVYPSFDSFQLEDIAKALHYNLEDAHDALADAEATVHIFKELFKKATCLPLVTLEKLQDLAASTTHETYLFFTEALDFARKRKQPLAEDLVVVNQIALKKPKKFDHQEIKEKKAGYPVSKKDKEQYLPAHFSYREAQAQMMDLIYAYFKADFSLEKLAIEVPPGVGKSLGYLFPAAFLEKTEEPIVVSTYTTVLQEQLLEETIPVLATMLKRPITATLIKSSRHYLSLSVFERFLKEITADDSEAYLCMRILVWLTETQTGDLSEIHAGSHLDLIFWQDIRTAKNQYIDNHWQEYEFYERVKEASRHSEFLITNHSYLANDWKSDQPLLTDLKYVILDEAHHFPDIAVQTSTITLKGNDVLSELAKMGSLANETGIFKLIYSLYLKNQIKQHDLQVLARTTKALTEMWENFYEELLEHFSDQKVSRRQDSKFVEKEYKLNFLTLKQKKWRQNIFRVAEEFIWTSQKVVKAVSTHFKELDNEQQLLLIELGQVAAFIKDWHRRLKHIFTFEEHSSEALRWVSFVPENMAQTFQFHVLKWGEQNSFVDYLATHSKVVFTSSTLSFQNSETYFSSQLKNLPLQFYQFESPFDYGRQVKLMLPTERINPKTIHKEEYPKVLARHISQILSETKVNTVVLFRSLAVLEEVYELLVMDRKLIDHLILAQSISGTRNRILKNFRRNKPAVILGADSFFEGLDLPDTELELIILTRLPFSAPNTPLNRLKTSYLKDQEIDPFMGEILPQATMKFKQAFGRLIRQKSDRGVMVVLDDRILSAGYAKIFTEALPQGVEMEVYPNKELGKEIQRFLKRP